MTFMNHNVDLLHKLQTFDEKSLGFFQQDADSTFPILQDEPTGVTDWGAPVPNDLTFCMLVEQQNLVCESHEVTTSDGYKLNMLRVRDPKSPYYNKDAKAVFVQHGLLADSNDWIVLGSKSLAVQLARAGYDAWFGNNRGTRYSRGHVKYDPERSVDGKYYFDYSFYELGKFDAPA